MVVEGVDLLYKKYLSKKDSRWQFGNQILYRMCEENPRHDNENIVVGKFWLIGRSYAAAIERRKNKDENENGDDFYYEKVAPKMIKIGEELDVRGMQLKKSKRFIEQSLEDILSTHNFLMDVFQKLTGLEKRSLASKYLHFHCPEMFFIYDSRARIAIREIVKRPDKNCLSEISSYDEEYADFVCRMLELQNYLKMKKFTNQKPRQLDSYLLSAVK